MYKLLKMKLPGTVYIWLRWIMFVHGPQAQQDNLHCHLVVCEKEGHGMSVPQVTGVPLLWFLGILLLVLGLSRLLGNHLNPQSTKAPMVSEGRPWLVEWC